MAGTTIHDDSTASCPLSEVKHTYSECVITTVQDHVGMESTVLFFCFPPCTLQNILNYIFCIVTCLYIQVLYTPIFISFAEQYSLFLFVIFLFAHWKEDPIQLRQHCLIPDSMTRLSALYLILRNIHIYDNPNSFEVLAKTRNCSHPCNQTSLRKNVLIFYTFATSFRPGLFVVHSFVSSGRNIDTYKTALYIVVTKFVPTILVLLRSLFTVTFLVDRTQSIKYVDLNSQNLQIPFSERCLQKKY